ncbi:MAG: hypothetical protein KKA84_05255 [Bacteroidetes bacterium]|nr:hypothetical protein [Bacteroidota bacterium]
MASDSKSNNDLSKINTNWIKSDENIQRQYDRAISLVEYYVQLTWLVFGAFLLTETVLLAAIASISDKSGSSENWVFGGAILGLILTYPWWASFRYNHTLYLLHLTEAVKSEPVTGLFFTNGKRLIDGEAFLGPLQESIKIPWAARLRTPNFSVQLLIVAFIIVFMLIVSIKVFNLVECFLDYIKYT